MKWSIYRKFVTHVFTIQISARGWFSFIVRLLGGWWTAQWLMDGWRLGGWVAACWLLAPSILQFSTLPPKLEFSMTPKPFLICSNISFVCGLVKISTDWSSNLQNSRYILPLLISYRMKWYLVSICLLLLWKTWFFDSSVVELLSQ